MPEILFSKKIYKYETLNHLYFGPSFVFWATALGVLAGVLFNILASLNHGGRHFHSVQTPPPLTTTTTTTTIKKLPTALTCWFR